MRLAIDFDGTIVENQYPEIGGLRDGAKRVIRRLWKEGHSIIINTCRCAEYEADAKEFLIENGIPFHYINCNLPSDIESFGMDCRKISGDIYIDDKQVGELPHWEKIYEYIQEKNS